MPNDRLTSNFSDTGQPVLYCDMLQTNCVAYRFTLLVHSRHIGGHISLEHDWVLHLPMQNTDPLLDPVKYIVDPVKYIVSFSVKSNPCTQRLYHLLLLQNFKNKVILIFCSDYSEVSSQILTTRSRVAPVRGRSVDDVLTRISMTNPILWTT